MIQNPTVLLLALSVFIGVLHIALQAISATKDLGRDWNAGARDDDVKPGVMAGRLDRALRNFLETYPLFIAAMVAAYLGGQEDHVVETAGWVYLIARLVYIPLYAFAVKYVRSLVWVISLIAIIVIAVSALLP